MPFAPGQSGHPGGKWKPGQSGNPGGRPKTRPFKEALARLLNEEEMKKSAAALVAKAQNGDVSALKEIADRMDGKVPTPVVGDTDHPPIQGYGWHSDSE